MKDFLSEFVVPGNKKNTGRAHRPGPVVTISRECGCSANRIATKLSKLLTGYNYLSETKTEVEWKWVSKETIEMAHLGSVTPAENVQKVFLGEAEKSIPGLTTDFSNLKVYDDENQQDIEKIKTVIRTFADEGHCIIVGRAASFIAQDIPNRLSVRLQAPLEWRVNRIMQINNLSFHDARQYVFNVDRQRNLFVENVAGRQLENTDFDLIFNYATLLDDHIVDVIVNVLKNKRIIANSEEE